MTTATRYSRSLLRMGDNAIYTDREGVSHMVSFEEGLALYYAPEAPEAPAPAPVAPVIMDDGEDDDWMIENMARDHWNRSHL